MIDASSGAFGSSRLWQGTRGSSKKARSFSLKPAPTHTLPEASVEAEKMGISSFSFISCKNKQVAVSTSYNTEAVKFLHQFEW